MACSFEARSKDESFNHNLQIIKHPSFSQCNNLSLPWFDLRVFYVRISNFEVNNSTPEFLTLNHIPLNPHTLLEVNGIRCGIYSDGVSSQLRRDRIDKKSEEATFVSTDSIRLNGSVKFEVFDKEDLILSGVLEMSNADGFVGESKNSAKRWTMNCESEMTVGTGFLKGKHGQGGPELMSPKIEVFVAGSFAGTPIILTKNLQLSFRKKHSRKGILDVIPENESAEDEGGKDVSSDLNLQVAEYGTLKAETEEDYTDMYYGRREYMEGEDGELSWFNAGVRVGVGIGLGVCLGLGIGVGLLVRTTRNFKRRLL